MEMRKSTLSHYHMKERVQGFILIDESIIFEIIRREICKCEIFVVPLSPNGDFVGIVFAHRLPLGGIGCTLFLLYPRAHVALGCEKRF